MDGRRQRERLLVVGNGMASVRFLERLLTLDPGRFAVTIVGAEPGPAYNRVLLSALLAGDATDEDILLRPRRWYEQNGVRLVSGDSVVRSMRRDARQRSRAASGSPSIAVFLLPAPIRSGLRSRAWTSRASLLSGTGLM